MPPRGTKCAPVQHPPSRAENLADLRRPSKHRTHFLETPQSHSLNPPNSVSREPGRQDTGLSSASIPFDSCRCFLRVRRGRAMGFFPHRRFKAILSRDCRFPTPSSMAMGEGSQEPCCGKIDHGRRFLQPPACTNRAPLVCDDGVRRGGIVLFQHGNLSPIL